MRGVMPLDENEKSKIALDALLSEASRLGDAIAERHAAAERFVAVAGAILGVGLTLGLFQHQRAVLTGLPFAVIVILIYMIQIYTDAGMHSGHRQALETKLNREFGYAVVVGQSYVAAGYGRRRSVGWTLGLVSVIWLATAVSGGFALFRLLHPEWIRIVALIAYILFLVLTMIVLKQAMSENKNAEESARKIALAAWPNHLPPKDDPHSVPRPIAHT
jgi:hypothetical protein